ncbi:hypothetical protein GCM10022243_60710 [Saccharothrix violaceirubra]
MPGQEIRVVEHGDVVEAGDQSGLADARATVQQHQASPAVLVAPAAQGGQFRRSTAQGHDLVPRVEQLSRGKPFHAHIVHV